MTNSEQKLVFRLLHTYATIAHSTVHYCYDAVIMVIEMVIAYC